MEKENVGALLRANSYPGRTILLGRDETGEHAVIAYAIMGRSANSRNRVFTPRDGGIVTEAADPAKLADPSLIIYAPVRVLGGDTIVTNGDQTVTIYDALSAGGSFEDALRARTFEPDAPNFTPRVSGLVRLAGGGCSFRLSILKSDCGDGRQCLRYFYEYEHPAPGEGRLISTYRRDGSPIPSFEGEPIRVGVAGGIDAFGALLWESFDEANKVSLFVRYLRLSDGAAEDRIYNKYKKLG